MDVSKSKKKQIKELTEKCKSKQGEYLPSHHGSGSWATTYSTEFINSACELYLIFQDLNLGNPLSLLSNQFRLACIRSCRGAEFGFDNIEYLYKTHLRHRIEELNKKTKQKTVHNRTACPYCNKMVVDLTQHVSQSHPNHWNTYFFDNSIKLKGNNRCSSCGSFLKTMDGHNERCLKTLDHVTNK